MENEQTLSLKEEERASKQRSKLAISEAKKERTERLFVLRKNIKERKAALSLEKERIQKDASLSQEEKSSQLKMIAASQHSLSSYYLRQSRAIKSETSYKARHRHFISAVDAFFSQPPMWIVNLICVLIFIGLFIYFGIEGGLFRTNGSASTNLVLFFRGLFVPDYDLFFATGPYTSFTQSVLYLCIQTFGIAFIGTLFSAILSIPFGFLASKKLFGKWSYISMIILIVIRTIPEIVFCFIMITVTGFGPITGVVVLSIQSIGMIGKMYSDNLDSIDMSFSEALDSAGASRLSKIRLGVFPQVFPNFISTVLYRFDLNLRTASILGLVGAGDMGRLILTYTQNANWPQLGALIWGLLIMVLIVDFISSSIRKKLV